MGELASQSQYESVPTSVPPSPANTHAMTSLCPVVTSLTTPCHTPTPTTPASTPGLATPGNTPASLQNPGLCTPLFIDTKSDSCSLNVPPLAYMANLESKSDTNSLIVNICRICHSPGDEMEPLISPCRCAGSLQFIHNQCLMKWLEITTRKSRKPPRCELCHFQYHRHKKFKFHHWRFPRVSQQDKILHIVFIVNLLIMIGCAVATVMCFLSDKGQISKLPRNKVDLTTEEIITLSCGVLFFVSFFIAMSVQIKAKHTIYQLFVKFIMQNMEWEIDEYDKSTDSLYKNVRPPTFV